ncbi:hypothetical protein C0991_011491, partial [Blastosporella zonata]
ITSGCSWGGIKRKPDITALVVASLANRLLLMAKVNKGLLENWVPAMQVMIREWKAKQGAAAAAATSTAMAAADTERLVAAVAKAAVVEKAGAEKKAGAEEKVAAEEKAVMTRHTA